MIIGTLGDASKASVVFFFSPFRIKRIHWPLFLLLCQHITAKSSRLPFPSHQQHSHTHTYNTPAVPSLPLHPGPFLLPNQKKTTQSAYAMACYGVGPWNAVAPSRCIHASIPGITSSLLAPLQPSRCGVPSPQTDVYAREDYLHSTCIRTKLIAPGPRTTPAQYLGRQVRYLGSYLV